MAVLKCKMCGGDLRFESGAVVAECEYCGTMQTLPKARDEVVQQLFNRANNLRIKCEFDKAEQVYEKILQNSPNEPEAHWGIILCKYGIEYVEDPKTFKRIPTCHRTSYDVITTDADYIAAVENADAVSRAVYETEAKTIDSIQKDILNIVRNEQPFDVFICYKESDEHGKRTVDSVFANDIYHQLTQEGLKVFYAAITLEDKLGQKYEPYIFAALNSAKAMLVIGTKPEYFSAVWVKNEWSRYLKLIKTDRSKILIPCYKNMDAYDLPEEFSHLQAQDMSKIGFINDIVRNIKKIATKEDASIEKPTSIQDAANTAPLLERAFMFLEDSEWNSATEYCEKVLDINPKCAEAYLCKLLCDLSLNEESQLSELEEPFDANKNYAKIMRFGDADLKNRIGGYLNLIKEHAPIAKVGVNSNSKGKGKNALKYTLLAIIVVVAIIIFAVVFKSCSNEDGGDDTTAAGTTTTTEHNATTDKSDTEATIITTTTTINDSTTEQTTEQTTTTTTRAPTTTTTQQTTTRFIGINGVAYNDSSNWGKVVNNVFTAKNGGLQLKADGWKTYDKLFIISMVPAGYDNQGTTNGIGVAVYPKGETGYDDAVTFENRTKEDLEAVLGESIQSFTKTTLKGYTCYKAVTDTYYVWVFRTPEAQYFINFMQVAGQADMKAIGEAMMSTIQIYK